MGDVLGALAESGHALWGGEILRMTMWPQASTPGRRPQQQSEPDYSTAAQVLTYIVNMGHGDWASGIARNMLVYGENGPDCFDLSFTLGAMVGSSKATQAAKILLQIYGKFLYLTECTLNY